MTYNSHVESPDVILIGSGIMSSNLGAMLKKIAPELKIQLYEVSNELAQESSNGWHNAGTGHAGICELSYTPFMRPDGTVDVSKAIEIFGQFELSKLFWGYALKSGMIQNGRDFINPVPHISFVYGEKSVQYLEARYKGLTAHHFFQGMEFTTDPERVHEWAPLLMEGREKIPVAATKMDNGTDVNFGEISRKLIHWLSEQPGCGVATNHRVVGLKRTSRGWDVTIQAKGGNRIQSSAKFVFVGAGGGSLPLLQMSGIAEGKGFGGFPIGGQWLVCDSPDIVSRHQAKVYGQSPGAAPTMAVPHLDTRVIDGKKSLLFGPYAAWTTKFLHKHGSFFDLPGSMRLDNVSSLIKVGLYNLPLVRYLIQQGTQSMASRMKSLREFYPDAKDYDWRLIDAGIRVQAIKKEDGKAGIVHYGTEIVTDADHTISALLGASPGASVSVYLMLEVIKKCFPDLVNDPQRKPALLEMFPCYGENIASPEYSERFPSLDQQAESNLFS
ncbi:putative malate:quinone oxidoreductase 2 [Pirellula sp. SH-Sr6A]|uniref:malate dehydrogenase (quinone) n=1 Tax=Pirellula sp. SH-Sr6A TaxID=1632865 RepID=UPI00078BA5FE|nr:malate dehydrogenase (quinone) [Pirellula sp. SH-Sr6A]AMV33574.1 putative malate:quinone oxidoreductase 2 [Pirellula sp. SH-Sr6A]